MKGNGILAKSHAEARGTGSFAQCKKSTLGVYETVRDSIIYSDEAFNLLQRRGSRGRGVGTMGKLESLF